MKSAILIKQKHFKYGEYFAIHYPEQDRKTFKTEANMKKQTDHKAIMIFTIF